MQRVEVGQPLELALFFFVGGSCQFQLVLHGVAMRVAEGVDADDGQLAGVLEHFVVHALVLDAPALVAGFHRAQHAASLGNALEFHQHRLFQQLGEFFDDERALRRVLVLGQAPFAVDDELDRHCPAHGIFGWRGDGFIKRVGVQAVAVVVDGDQRLQGGNR